MKLAEVLKRVKRDRPGESTDGELIHWLSQLDTRWQDEVLDTHFPEEEDPERFTGYTEDTDRETELLIGEPDDEVYLYWLYAHIDLRLGEIERYNAESQMFNAAWDAAAKRYNRHHIPQGRIIHRVAYWSPVAWLADEDPLNQRTGW